MNQRTTLTTAQKALQINLNSDIYGTFAEIGAGQETVREFFRAGAASGTIAKAMSAYDKAFSDDIYGIEEDQRYVTQSRLQKMLHHEYGLIEKRLDREVHPDKTYFAYANTVATINFTKTFKGHGWMGIRFQTEAQKQTNEIILHFRLHENEAKHQQETVGRLGTNLIFGAYKLYEDSKEFLKSLYDNIDSDAIEIDLINFTGPDFEDVDNRLMSLQLIKNGYTDAVIFGPEGNNLLPAELLYKKHVLAMRGSFRPVTKVNMDMIKRGYDMFTEDRKVNAEKTVVLWEITLNNLLSDGELDEQDFLDRAEILCSLGQTVLISNYQEYYKLVDYFGRFSKKRQGLVMGVNNLTELFKDKYYRDLQGGILEAFGRIFSKDLKIMVYPFIDHENEGKLMRKEDAEIHPRFRPIIDYLIFHNRIIDIDEYDHNITNIFSREVLNQIRGGEEGWGECLPEYVHHVIRDKKLFGYNGEPKEA
ncbi:TonB-dependent receptor [Schleiferiaceae bacterium]|nr:TonB-dependent receptor [Schleiferiaceae bacterium]